MLDQFDIPDDPQVLLPPGYPGLHGSPTSTSLPPLGVPPGVLGLAGQTLGHNNLNLRPQHGLWLGGGGHISHNV